MLRRTHAETQRNEERYFEEEPVDHLEVILELPQEVFEYDAQWHRHHRALELLLKGPQAD
jgi:hypothetical protein